MQEPILDEIIPLEELDNKALRLDIIGRRLAAWVLDMVVLGLVISIIIEYLWPLLKLPRQYHLSTFVLLLIPVYKSLWEGHKGQTLGKYLFRVRVVSALDQSSISSLQAFGRNVWWWLLVGAIIALPYAADQQRSIIQQGTSQLFNWLPVVQGGLIIIIVGCTVSYWLLLFTRPPTTLHDRLARTACIIIR